MKKVLSIYLRGLLLSGILLFMGYGSSYATHIFAIDLRYDHVGTSGNIYKVQIIAYGDCSGDAFSTLRTSKPHICIYNAGTFVHEDSLDLRLSDSGENVTQVCPSYLDSTSCSTHPSVLYPGLHGTKRYVYEKNIDLGGTSSFWRFRFNGDMSRGQSAGRSSAITTITGPGMSVIYLEDTLNNATAPGTGYNSSPILTVLPTPYYCGNTGDTYSPVPTDADGDVLLFQLVSGRAAGLFGFGGCSSTPTNVTYIGGTSATNPIQLAAGTLSFSTTTGQLAFNPSSPQATLVVYNIEEHRSGVLVGTCQREMTFTVQSCTGTTPSSAFRDPSAGVLVDSFTLAECSDIDTFTVHINPTVTTAGDTIHVTPGTLPSWIFVNIVGNGTGSPLITVTGVSGGVTPGIYTFNMVYYTSHCPIGGSSTVTYTIEIDSAAGPITGTLKVCPFLSTTLSDHPAGTWTSAHTTIATVVSATGVVWGVAAGTDSITFLAGHAQCKAYAVVTVSPAPVITGTVTVCKDATSTLVGTPGSGTWSSSVTSVATVGTTTGTVTGVATGTTIITYTEPTNNCIDTALFTVSRSPSAIGGPSVVCALQTITLTDSVSGGTWTSGNGGIATVGSSTGIVTGVSGGTVSITYATSAACSVFKTITVNPAPAQITGTTSICIGSTTTLSSTTSGGTWSSSAGGIATVGSTGVVTGVGSGNAIITYTIPPSGCWDTIVVSVTSGVAAITGTLTVCAGSTTNLADATPGGIWSSVTPAVATVGSTGTGSTAIVGGVSIGTDTIKYSLSATCFAKVVVTVSAGPGAIAPSTPVSICVTNTTTLTDPTSGGVWSSGATAVATVGTGGVVTGVSVGTATISYSIGTCVVTKIVTITSGGSPNTPASATLCIGGATVTFTNSSSGGTWTSSNTAIATIGSTSGIAGGVATGTAVISYSVGSCISTSPVTVAAQPAAIAPSGPISICSGSSTPFADATPGGTWSSSTTSIATVGSSGTVYGVASGTAVISYSIGSCSATKIVTVTSGGSPILPGTATICTTNTVTLTNATPGGTWSSGSTGIATVGSTGIVTGVATGVATISYTSGTCISTAVVTVTPGAGPISPAGSTVCIGSTVSFTDGVAGGTWSSTATGIATVGSTGIVTGVSAGTATISYTIGTCAATVIVTVTSGGSPIIPNPATVCIGVATTFTDAAAGGTWSLGTTAVATITGTTATTATVNGLATGTAILTYTQGSCVSHATISVNTAPAAITPGTPISICTATTTTLADATTGGVWSSGATGVATVGSTGIVTGVSAGTVTISYSIGGCAATKVITVTAGAAPISPTNPTLCTGNTLTLLEAAPGGTWSSSATGVATVGSTGIIGGVGVGTATISYSLGTCSTSVIVTVNLGADPGTISGPLSLCTGTTIALTETVTGGTWSSSSAGIATVGSTGIVGGVTGGIVTISYSVTNACGTSSARHIDTVYSTTGPGPIVGPSLLCAGLVTTLTNSDPGGTWSVSNGHASVNPSTGLLTGISPGIDTVTYTVSNSCGSASVKFYITIGSYLTAGTISGPSSICGTGTITLTESTTGGVWSSGATAIATVGTGGIVTGVSNGVDTIFYTVTSSCGSAAATHVVTVSPGADAGTIVGTSTLCVGNFTLFTDAAPGGTWSSVNGNATVTPGGLVTAVAVGTDSILYTVTNSCGSVSAIKAITIIPGVSAGVITGPSSIICLGSTMALTDAAPGGVWSTTNGHASVSTVGLVTGLSGGVDTILYTVTSTCGNAVASYVVTVSPTSLTAGTILGPSSVCVSSVITLTDTVAGGVWSSANANATITIGGLVTGILPGLDTITYTVTGVCGIAQTTHLVTVNSLPVPGSISGPTSICVGTSDTLTVTGTTGGGWTSSNANATIGSSSGIVTGVTAGSSIITYTLSNACGTVVATLNLTINESSPVLPITGVTHVCVGSTALLSCATPGGVWSSSNPSISTVTSFGLVTGVRLGVDTIYYTLTNTFGCISSSMVRDTVQTSPTPAPITGPHHACPGVLDTLSNAIMGGTWSSSNVAVATIDLTTGQMLNISAGSAIISYLVSNGCGTILDTTLITVNPAPNPGVINGPDSLCGGTTITLTDTASGGIWSSSNNVVATIGSTGIVTGLSIGADTIYYTVSNGFSCSGTASKVIHVAYIMPNVTFSPSGTATLCRGHSVNMSVVATVSTGLEYQWYQDSVPIPGATTADYSTYTTGLFKVLVSNGACNVTLTGTSVISAPPNPVIAFTPPNILYTSAFVTYQWYLDWVAIPGATSSLIHETGNGVYHVVVTDLNGCTDTSGQYSVVVVSGVNTIINASDIKVYPNPASSMLHIDAPAKVNVSILSVDGKVLIEQKDAKDINISPLSNGMYMIMVYDQNKLLLKTAKFAKVE